ncbi:MAG: hypothetical protein ABSC42_08865 [Tepidisphaeraceae bacterium]|jgi:hypothetical protein
MQSDFLRWPLAAAILLLFTTSGCQTAGVGPLPAGPGVATERDLTPWLATATETEQFGCLMEINVPSQQGSYDTWALATPVATQSVEVDVRACAAAAADFNGKTVIVKGKTIARVEHHLPLLVAERMVPADAHGNALPHSPEHVAMAPEPDPVTGQFDPLVEFQASADAVTLSSAK